jgi:hypothetical protein
VSEKNVGLELAMRFHEIYERLAPSFGYETRTETRKFDPTTPNGKLMIAVCGEILSAPAKPGVEEMLNLLGSLWQHFSGSPNECENKTFDAIRSLIERAPLYEALVEAVRVWEKDKLLPSKCRAVTAALAAYLKAKDGTK